MNEWNELLINLGDLTHFQRNQKIIIILRCERRTKQKDSQVEEEKKGQLKVRAVEEIERDNVNH